MVKDLDIITQFEFQQHPIFPDCLTVQIPFDNGYGLSIITKKPNVKNNYSMASANGSWDDGTFEVAITRRGEFYFYRELEDEDYRSMGGIWVGLTVEEVMIRYNFVKGLREPVKGLLT